MSIKSIIKQIGSIGGRLSAFMDGGTLPAIEKDIILQELREVYVAVRNLEKEAASDQAQDSDREPGNETLVNPESVTPPETREISDPSGGTDTSGSSDTAVSSDAPGSPEVPETKEDDAGASITVAEHEQTVPEDAKPASGDAVTGSVQKQPEKEAAREILADRLKGEKRFINESLAGRTQDVSSKIQSKPISSIGSALGINDRFKLIKELFNGDKDSFQDTMNVLDNSGNFNEAFNYINSSFQWDMEDEPVQLLLELVRRKFIVKNE